MKTTAELIVLSNTERDTLMLYCCNLCTKEIAEKRFLCIETIKTHSKSMRAKFNANQMSTVVFRAMAMKLLTDEEIKRALSCWEAGIR